MQAGASNATQERAALESGCGVYELSRAKIRLTGGDRMRWLNGMVTNNIRDLAVNHGTYNFLLNAKGRIDGDLYAYNLGDTLMVDTDESERENVLAFFDKYIIMDDVAVADESAVLTAIGVTGPQTREVLGAAGIDAPELAPLELGTPKCDCPCDCLQCTLVRGDDPAGHTYEIWIAPGMVKSTWDALVAAGATPVGTKTLEQRRIELGIPRYGADIRDRDLPQETGQDRAMNFTKGCYLGQEIVERIRSQGQVHRILMKLAVAGAGVAAGAKIVSGEREVGEITSVAGGPGENGMTPAMGYLRREFADKELSVSGAKVVVR